VDPKNNLQTYADHHQGVQLSHKNGGLGGNLSGRDTQVDSETTASTQNEFG